LVDINRPVLWGLLGKAWLAGAGPLTALFVAYSFSPILQGYYYTFLSLLALQILLELGLTTVIGVFASHEWAKLSRDSNGRVTGDAEALSRLESLTKLGLRWFSIGGLVLALGLAGLGSAFFHHTSGSAEVAWLGPWILLCLLTGASVVMLPAWALLHGCNQITEVNFYRLLESFFRTLALWAALLLGAGLWSPAVSLLAALVMGVAFLLSRYRRFFLSIFQAPLTVRVDWKREIFPMQWRIAVSWVAGYFMFSLFTPVAFHYQGPVVAGQTGMTWAFVGGIGHLATTWLQVKSPVFAILVARRDFAELDRVALRTAIISFVVAAIASAGLLVALAMLALQDHELHARFLPLFSVAIFAAAEVLNRVSNAQAVYLRSFKQEPFMWLSVACGLLVAVTTFIGAIYFTMTEVALGYLASVILALAWGTSIFVRCRREWTK
jgi:hypothetical protein